MIEKDTDRQAYSLIELPGNNKKHLYIYSEFLNPDEYTELFKDIDLKWDLENTELYIHINSPGGNLDTLIAMINRLEKIKNIITIAEGSVMSAGLFLFLIGKTRVAQPFSTFLAHSVQVSGGISSPIENEFRYMDKVKKVSDLLIDRYFKKFFTKSELNELKKGTDIFLDINEAKKRGIINDSIENIELR